MRVAEIQKEVYQQARSKGWWSSGNRDIGMLIALAHSELSEALEEYRNGYQLNEIRFENGKPEGFPVEIADTFIRILDLCEHLGIDLEVATAIKHRYNGTRPFRHGGKLN